MTMEYRLQDLLDSINEYRKGQIGGDWLAHTLKANFEHIVDAERICRRCCTYKEAREWTEHHPHGDTYVEEPWVGYYCPECGRED